jgi:beta-glucosidase
MAALQDNEGHNVELELEAEVRRIVDDLTLDERLDLMSGDGKWLRGNLEMAKRYNADAVVAGEIPRHGLPGIRFTDGPRGIVMGAATAFPAAMARAATFDPTLEQRIGDVIGVEGRALGANLFAGVCINLVRHPAWGRAQETYGEDTHLLSEMGVALTRGVRPHLLVCVKHFAVNSMENSRMWVDVQIDERDLHDLYLPHFKAVVDEGAESVMSAYNTMNGERCGQHRHLLTEILKEQWGFDGFVMSDFTFGVTSTEKAANGGLDMEMPFRMHFGRLKGLVRSGKVPGSRVRDAATRVVRAQLRFRDRGEPERYTDEAVACAEHRALSREAASRGMVLLRNAQVGESPILPLDLSTVRTLAVIGKLASVPNIGDLGSSQVHPPEVVTLLDGLRAAGEGAGFEVRYDDGSDLVAAAALAADCDVAVVVAGTTFRDEGEFLVKAGGDRTSLRLRTSDEALLQQVARSQPRTVAVLMGGSAFVTDRWHHLVPAMLTVWYPGMEGGHALADVLLGSVEPQGRLPLTWPASTNDLPPFRRFARRITYGPLHGYRMREATGQAPSFPFGFGLGYSATTWSTPEVVQVGTPNGPKERVAVVVQVDVTATGDRDAVEVVQAYVPEVLGSHPEPLRTLRGFTRVEVPAGATVRAEVQLAVPVGVTEVLVGRSSDPADLVAVPLG